MKKAVPAVLCALGLLTSTGCSASMTARPAGPYFTLPPLELAPGDVLDVRPTYEGWWSTLATAPEAGGLPHAVALVNTESGAFVEGYNRLTGERFTQYVPVPRPSWPEDSVVVLDARTTVVWDSFPVDASGMPRPAQDGTTVAADRSYPPVAGELAAGDSHVFGLDYDTGETVYLGTSAGLLFSELNFEPPPGIKQVDW